MLPVHWGAGLLLLATHVNKSPSVCLCLPTAISKGRTAAVAGLAKRELVGRSEAFTILVSAEERCSMLFLQRAFVDISWCFSLRLFVVQSR